MLWLVVLPRTSRGLYLLGGDFLTPHLSLTLWKCQRQATPCDDTSAFPVEVCSACGRVYLMFGFVSGSVLGFVRFLLQVKCFCARGLSSEYGIEAHWVVVQRQNELNCVEMGVQGRTAMVVQRVREQTLRSKAWDPQAGRPNSGSAQPATINAASSRQRRSLRSCGLPRKFQRLLKTYSS